VVLLVQQQRQVPKTVSRIWRSSKEYVINQ
jgi:hypothetical protein